MQDTRSALDEVEEHEPIQSVDENTLGASPKNTTKQPVVDRLITVHPALKYLGFSLLMAYHYLMWFCPSSFFKTDLLAASVTVAWLWNLVGTAFFMIVTVCFLGRTRHLSDYPWVMRVVTVLLIVATALLLYGAPITSSTYVIYIFSFVAGGLEGLMWILWGESLTRFRANFSVVHIGTTFGATVLVVMIVSLFIPADLSPLFVVLLVAFSGVFLYAHKKVRNLSRALAARYGQTGVFERASGLQCWLFYGRCLLLSGGHRSVGMVLDRRIHLRDRRGDRCSVDLACLGAFGALQSESFDVQALSVLLGLRYCGADLVPEPRIALSGCLRGWAERLVAFGDIAHHVLWHVDA